jgi:hypothetical protein
MKLVYPEFLWALFALSIPVIIHLFHFRKHKVLFFSSLQFLQKVDQDNRSTKRLKNLLVLITRLLALACLIIAFAQPYIPANSTSSQAGKPVLAIYIDNSFSMTAKGAEGELLSMARELARKMILNAGLETRILLNTNELSGSEQRFITKAEALEELDKIEISPMIRQLDDVVNWQRSFIQRQHETIERLGSRQYVLLSDFQQHSSRFSAIGEDAESFYYPIQLLPQSLSNIYIDSAWFDSPVHKTGLPVELNIRVVNTGKDALSSMELHVEIDRMKRDVFLDIPAQSSLTTTINYTDKSPGSKEGILTVNDKQLFWDDDYFISYDVVSHSSILCIDGPSASSAVPQVFAVEPFYRVTTLAQDRLTFDVLNGKDLVLLNGVNSIPSSLANQLSEFVQNGGALALFPGTEININEWSVLLRKLELPAITQKVSSTMRMDRINEDDVFFAGVFEKSKAQATLPMVSNYYGLSTSSSANYFPLIELKNGQPLIIRSRDKFNTLLYASSLDPSFSAITSNAIFPTLLLRIGELSQRKLPLSLTIGSDAFFPIYTDLSGEQPLRLVGRKSEYIPQIKKEQSVTYISIAGVDAIRSLSAGNYSVQKEDKIARLSLNYNRNESSSKVLSESELVERISSKCKNVRFKEITETGAAAQLDLEKPFEYWKLFTFLALLFMLTEVGILKFWK